MLRGNTSAACLNAKKVLSTAKTLVARPKLGRFSTGIRRDGCWHGLLLVNCGSETLSSLQATVAENLATRRRGVAFAEAVRA